MKTKVISKIARLIQARNNCKQSNNLEWFNNHTDRLHEIEKNNLPSGSGIDTGTKIDMDMSNESKVILTFSYHHMDEGGYYDGWTEHKAIITPAFDGVIMRITGRDRNQIKEYLYDLFDQMLNEETEF